MSESKRKINFSREDEITLGDILGELFFIYENFNDKVLNFSKYLDKDNKNIYSELEYIFSKMLLDENDFFDFSNSDLKNILRVIKLMLEISDKQINLNKVVVSDDLERILMDLEYWIFVINEILEKNSNIKDDKQIFSGTNVSIYDKINYKIPSHKIWMKKGRFPVFSRNKHIFSLQSTKDVDYFMYIDESRKVVKDKGEIKDEIFSSVGTIMNKKNLFYFLEHQFNFRKLDLFNNFSPFHFNEMKKESKKGVEVYFKNLFTKIENDPKQKEEFDFFGSIISKKSWEINSDPLIKKIRGKWNYEITNSKNKIRDQKINYLNYIITIERFILFLKNRNKRGIVIIKGNSSLLLNSENILPIKEFLSFSSDEDIKRVKNVYLCDDLYFDFLENLSDFLCFKLINHLLNELDEKDYFYTLLKQKSLETLKGEIKNPYKIKKIYES